MVEYHDCTLQLKKWADGGDYLQLPLFTRTVFYRQWGVTDACADDTVLLLHGFPESSHSFHKVIDGLLAVFRRVVAFDMLGYGLSDKPDKEYCYSLISQADVALQVWRHLGVRGGHVISHDMGTSVLTELVCRQVNEQLPAFFNEGFKSLTFTNGSMVLGHAKLRVMQRLLLSRFGAIVSRVSRYSFFRKTVLSAHGGIGSKGLTDEDVQLLWAYYCRDDGHRKSHYIIRYLNDRKRYEQTRWLPALVVASKEIPIHFCWGDADRVAPIEMAVYLSRELCPSSVLSTMEGVGHFAQLSSADIWLKKVRNFYQER